MIWQQQYTWVPIACSITYLPSSRLLCFPETYTPTFDKVSLSRYTFIHSCFRIPKKKISNKQVSELLRHEICSGNFVTPTIWITIIIKDRITTVSFVTSNREFLAIHFYFFFFLHNKANYIRKLDSYMSLTTI